MVVRGYYLFVSDLFYPFRHISKGPIYIVGLVTHKVIQVFKDYYLG